MTHTESHDLLVDLACGELDAARAAEVESHVAECAECREEKAALEEARRLAAPLRELEEPTAGFDERFLEAARAEARLQHGNVGQVIEVTGNVRPLGVEAARIDAHAPVQARSAQRRYPRWMVRVAVGGSVAAAAALALVVSTTLETPRERASRAQSDEFRIRVQPAAPERLQPAAPEAVSSALRDAAEKNAVAQKEAPAAPPVAAVPPEPAVPAKKLEGHRPAAAPPAVAVARKQDQPAAAPEPQAAPAEEKDEGAKARSALRTAPSPQSAASSSGSAAKGGVVGGALGGTAQTPSPASPRLRTEASKLKAQAPVAQLGKSADESRPAEPAAQHQEPRQPQRLVEESPRADLAQQHANVDVSTMESNAQRARHGGNYALAVSLYRSAADLRRRADEQGAAAWNLAHAVECLAALGQFDEAKRVRDELMRSFPSETTALAAAQRALREVDVPATVPEKQ